jgi:hypothetical protein
MPPGTDRTACPPKQEYGRKNRLNNAFELDISDGGAPLQRAKALLEEGGSGGRCHAVSVRATAKQGLQVALSGHRLPHARGRPLAPARAPRRVDSAASRVRRAAHQPPPHDRASRHAGRRRPSRLAKPRQTVVAP